MNAVLWLAGDDAMFYGRGALCFEGISEVIDPAGNSIGRVVQAVKSAKEKY